MSFSMKMCDSTDLSELSREELISIINQMKEKISSLETKLNKYENESKKCQSKKRQKSSGSEALDRQTVNKKSFSDRICDDLYEEILQYLSLEDKLKLEGVSKQFQRTVLKKHYELTIETKGHIPNRKVKEEYKYHYIKNKFIEMKSLEVLLKKCQNISSIEFRRPLCAKTWLFAECEINPVFRLITKYCNNLREVKTCGNWINNKDIIKFQRKFGQKIKFFDRFHKPINFNLFPNIKKFVCSNPYDYNRLKQVLPQLKLKKLTHLTMDIEEEEVVKTCVDTFPTLTHLDLDFCGENSIYSSLDYISNLKNLIHFDFKNNLANDKLFCDSLKRMANKCQKLKSIKCSFQTNLEITQLLSPFKAFPALKRLNLTFYCYKNVFDINEYFSFEAFRGLSNITHLTIYLCGKVSAIKANILNQILLILPKLRYFKLFSEITATPEQVTQMANILSRLLRLQTLKLFFSECIDYNEIKVKIREKCRKIRAIEIKHN